MSRRQFDIDTFLQGLFYVAMVVVLVLFVLWALA